MKRKIVSTFAIVVVLSTIGIVVLSMTKSYACPPPPTCGECGPCEECQGTTCVAVKCTDPNNGQATGGDPVIQRTGEYHLTVRDLVIPGRVLPIEIVRTYRSQSDNNSPYGYGWDLNYNMNITKQADGKILFLNNGLNNTLRYKRISTSPKKYISPEGSSDWITEYADGTFERREKHGEKSYFDSNGVLQIIEDRTGNNTITFEYDDQGRIRTITNDLDRTITFDYYSDRWTITDFAPPNRTWTYYYSGDKDLRSVTDPNMLVTTYSYSSHNLLSITDSNGQTWIENVYDANDKVETQRYGNPDNIFRFAYTPTSNQTTVTDRRDVNTVTIYNDGGLALSETTYTFNPKLRPSDPNSYATSYLYDKNKNMMSHTLPRGNSIRYSYDSNKNVRTRTITDIGGTLPITTATFTYDSTFNFVHTAKDAKSNITTYDYNSVNGNLEKITYPEVNVIDAGGSLVKTSPVMAFTYNNYGQAETMTSPDGIVTKYEYYDDINDVNNYGRAKNIIVDCNENGLNITSTYKYDILGNVIEVNDPNGNITKFAYNVLGKIRQITDPCNNITDMRYNNCKQLSFIARPIGDTNQQTSFSYDILDHVKEITNPLGYLAKFSYDKEDNRSDVNDAEENNTHSEYDEKGLLWKVTDANGGVTTFGYTLNGDLNDINDAKGNITRYEYDGYDRLKKVIYSDDSNEQFGYDVSSNVISYTNRNGDTIRYEYDAMNRLIAKTRPSEPNTIFAYDIAGKLVNVNDGRAVLDGGGITKYKYDRIGRISEVNDIESRTVKYEYNSRGLRTKLTYPDDSNVTYEYDVMSRLTKVKYNGTDVAAYTYDQLGRRTLVTYGNNTGITYGYDIANRLTRLTNNLAGGTAIDFNYANYDKVGNRKSMKIGTANAQVYDYDKLYQLKSVDYNNGSSTTYDYDQLGNRTSAGAATYTSNALNQYEKVAGLDYSYDRNGNLTCYGTSGYHATNTLYYYDVENRLTNILYVSWMPRMETFYYYDYRGRRVRKNAWGENLVGGYSGTTTYDGDQIIADYDDSGNLLRKYVYGPGIDEPVCMINVADNNTAYYYHYDGLGSVVALSDVSANVAETYSYDVFGAPTIRNANGDYIPGPDAGTGNRYMFTGREYSELGLYYYRARFYSPNIGRFLQTDPIGYYDSMNLYTYCGNNPLNSVDPYGLTPWGYITGEDQYVFSRGVDSYLNDVSDSLIGVGQGVGDVARGVGSSIAHPVDTAKSAASGIANAVAHPQDTAKEVANAASDKVSKLLGDDPREAGRVIGQGAGTAAVVAIGARAPGFRAKLGIHKTPHPFPLIGRNPHIQLTIYEKGVDMSHVNIRIPLPK